MYILELASCDTLRTWNKNQTDLPRWSIPMYIHLCTYVYTVCLDSYINVNMYDEKNSTQLEAYNVTSHVLGCCNEYVKEDVRVYATLMVKYFVVCRIVQCWIRNQEYFTRLIFKVI